MLQKITTLFVATILLCNVAQTNAQQEIYSEISVKLNSLEDVQSLADNGFDIDHYQGNWQEGIRFFVTQNELNLINSLGYNVEVTIPNYKTYYTEQQLLDRAQNPILTKTAFVANGFDLGSMGGFYTNDEVVAKLDEMRAEYPNLITAKTSIGTTFEGRDIWMVKISDNPDIDEEEPAAHFDALHHAREPLSMATTINYMFYLLEKYETDAAIKFLVDNREIYFVPVVNPDGYVFNETTDPNGGGLWRKNRTPDTGGCVGVDLNRNYGFGYATNNSCSSPNPCSNIYRGPSAFSEAESVAIRDLLGQTEANTAFSTHSTAGTYLMPYGFDTSPPAFDIYSEWASAFLSANDYSYGVTSQMLGYTSCGVTRDYLHSEGIYGWTPEIAGSGFWPPESSIFDLVAENIRPFLFQTYIAGAYLDVQSHEILGDVLPGESFQLIVEIKNIGVGATANTTSVIVQTDNQNVIAPTASTFGDIPARERKDNAAIPFQFEILPEMEDGFFTITVQTIQDGIPNETIEIPVFLGENDVLFSDDAEGTAANWTASGNGTIMWGINNDDSYSGIQSFGDSNDGNGENDTENFFELNEVFDLTQVPAPRVQFAAKYSLPGSDIAQLQVSPNNGVDWETLQQFNRSEDWTIYKLNLSAYKESNAVKFRFRQVNDGAIPGDGFYFDDFSIVGYTSSILGVSDIDASEILVVPNPFIEKITVQLGTETNDVNVALYDGLGRKLTISEERKTNQIILTDVDKLSSGLYFLTITDKTNGKKTVKQLIKE